MPDLQTFISENPLIAAGVAGVVALIVIILLVVMFRPRSKEKATSASAKVPTSSATADIFAPQASAMTPAPEMRAEAAVPQASVKPAAPKAAKVKKAERVESGSGDVISANLSKDKKGWIRPNGKPPAGRVVQGRYQLGANEGVRSVDGLAVKANEKYKVTFSAQAVEDAKNGGRQNFMVGPIFVDGEGRVVGWWSEQPDINTGEGVRNGAVEAVAPKAAVQVYIGIHGSYNKQADPGDGIVAFSALELSKVA